ncbi:MAG TPA: hemerythrin domain-containing protein [Polyangia bacterium]|jgi:hemerythrin superfamily protein
MNAITLLKHQHREVEALFNQMHRAKGSDPRRGIFERIADALAVHSAIEEKRFYPAVKERTTEAILLESVEEHLAIKRVIADLLQLDAGDETFAAKVKVLEDEVAHHVEEEEETLFPRVEQMFDDEALESLGEAMEETQSALLQAGNPRQTVPSEIERAATI